MSQRYANNSALISAYLNQSTDSGHNRTESMSFTGNKLCSYNSLLAKLNTDFNILFIDKSIKHYSVTTGKQTYNLLKQFTGTVYELPMLSTKPNKVLQAYWGDIEELIGKYERSIVHKSKYKQRIIDKYNDVLSYAELMQIDKRTKEYKYKNIIFKQLFKHKLL